ncbi:insulinase family protein [Clostridium hydrogenum]|uniref:insulinase family protein n=1 Tax=Clostridium hydrogenum TaxID=2855764 RepID=UPI001F4497AD|nr:insulinase family protein [Clostridium hydrogenum]
MEFKIGESYSGFKLGKEMQIDEIKSKGRVFYHEKSGARLVSIENEDDNKTFSITFKTLPENSKGIPHILEHSVLCGSRKFPVKEPFVEILKGSLNTYLNAATYPDKTMYPVASRNHKDFRNLMDVYLDAVFYPNIYKYPEILMQEGWHYDIEGEDEKLHYKGVVYNEMKGVYSSPISVLLRKVDEVLFKDNTYGFDSGGNPDEITKLTYEEFIDFHKKFYHPSNSIIYLYGDVDLEKELKFINDEYLSYFNKMDIKNDIEMQKAFDKMEEREIEYSISNNEDEIDKTFFSLSFCTGNILDNETNFGLEILESILLETASSPLKRAIIEANIGKDVFGAIDNSILQPTFSIILKDSNLPEKDKFKNLVFDVLKELSTKGIDRKLIEAVINAREFEMREADYDGFPKGLEYNEKILDRMLHGGEPFENLKFEQMLAKIKAGIKDNYFEKLIEKYLLNNNHSVFITVKPKRGLEEENIQNLENELLKFKNELSKDELKEIIEKNDSLITRQETLDEKEDLDKIPMLSIEDINPKADYSEWEKYDEKGTTILYTPLNTKGISYINFYFDTTVVPDNMIGYVSLLSILIGRMSTSKYDFKDLSNEVNTHIGGVDFSVEPYGSVNEIDKYIPEFTVRTKVLDNKVPKLIELLLEIINNSIYDDFSRLRELISELKSRLDMSMQARAHRIASVRVASYYSQAFKYVELSSGIDFYNFIHDLDKNFEDKKANIYKNLKETSELIFDKNNLLVGYAGDKDSFANVQEQIRNFLGNIRNNAPKKNKYEFKLEKLNEGFTMASKVQYVAKGYNFKKLKFKNSGVLSVIKTIANYNYLWNKVRVQGGAYGVFSSFSATGNMSFCSYRDPNLTQTIEAFDSFYEYIDSFNEDDREITKYILGTISGLDMPLSNASKCERTVVHYLSGADIKYVQNIRDEILRTDASDIRKYSDLIHKCMEENCICAVGSEQKILENKAVFKNVISLFGNN